MGVPAFFRWLSRKYPSIVVPCDENVKSENSFDNVYLDMNGIIHPCTHPEHKAAPQTEEEMFEAIFEYIERLMKVTRPRKLLYMAVDGVAPRAKMNQQRSRRFRASKESIEKEKEIQRIKEELRDKGTVVEDAEKKKGFDSNVITPGTDFMLSLSKALRQWIDQKLSADNPDEDGIWSKDLVVILSDASVPGEGEHKIIDYIRKQKAQENYNPNISHLLCGADADLIMLALATHELDFTILREEFIPNQPRPCEVCSQYGHEMKECTGSARLEDQPNIIVTEPGFIYIRICVLREYLKRECGLEYDLERFIDDFVFLCFFVGNDFLPHLPSLEIREGAIDTLLNIYKDIMAREKSQKRYLTCNGIVNLQRAQEILHKLGEIEDEVFKRRQVDQKRFRQRQKRQKAQQKEYNVRWMKPEEVVGRGQQPAAMHNIKFEAANLRNATMQASNKAAAQQFKAMLQSPEATQNESRAVKRKSDELEESDSEPEDNVQLGSDGWKARYYYHKFDTVDYSDLSRRIAHEYVIGLCWVLRYYYQGCPDWKWFYPFHYAPFASDFVDIESLKVEFDYNAKPFRPLEQLMSVFPAASSANLPPSWRLLMMDSKSPIIDFYPDNFKIDLNGKHAAWMGVALLPFIDEERMFKALESVYPDLTKKEKARNRLGAHLLFASRQKAEIEKIVKDLQESEDGVTLRDPLYLDGMSGKVKLHKKYSEIYLNTLCVEFYDPIYPPNFVFPAQRLKGAISPPDTLKPEDFDHSQKNWRPVIGFQRPNQRASLGAPGTRMLNHYQQHNKSSYNSNYNSNYRGGPRSLSNTPNSRFSSPTGNQNYRFHQNRNQEMYGHTSPSFYNSAPNYSGHGHFRPNSRPYNSYRQQSPRGFQGSQRNSQHQNLNTQQETSSMVDHWTKKHRY